MACQWISLSLTQIAKHGLIRLDRWIRIVYIVVTRMRHARRLIIAFVGM